MAIKWRDWCRESFDEARKEHKLVLLDLTASWCHWCHVMDETTYSDPEVIRMIQNEFIPIRVDIDKRPDISERYNRGGFPTTAFISCKGENVWGTTYVPPEDMRRIMDSILRAKRSGEIDSALEKVRMPYVEVPSLHPKERTFKEIGQLDSLFDVMMEAYDQEHGGFGHAPKFPHKDMLDLVISRYARTADRELAEVVRHTIYGMLEGLYDGIEGGVFRYSVTEDWKVPHYEKMLETNAGFLSNLVHAHKTLGDRVFMESARGIARFMIDALQDPNTGGLSGSQDAQEEYYRSSREERETLERPSIDRTVYAGWNADASHALIEAGSVSGQRQWISAGIRAFGHIATELLDDDTQLMRHTKEQEIHLFEDQVSFLSAIRGMLELDGRQHLMDHAAELMKSIDRSYAHAEGGYGDIIPQEDGIGELTNAQRSLSHNSRYAYELAMFSSMKGEHILMDKARQVLDSFTQKQVIAHGIFGAQYVTAMDLVMRGPVMVEIHLSDGREAWTSELWRSAKDVFDPRIVVMAIREEDGEGEYASICREDACSAKIQDPPSLKEALYHALSGQV